MLLEKCITIEDLLNNGSAIKKLWEYGFNFNTKETGDLESKLCPYCNRVLIIGEPYILTVSPETGKFECVSCNKSGDLFDLLYYIFFKKENIKRNYVLCAVANTLKLKPKIPLGTYRGLDRRKYHLLDSVYTEVDGDYEWFVLYQGARDKQLLSMRLSSFFFEDDSSSKPRFTLVEN